MAVAPLLNSRVDILGVQTSAQPFDNAVATLVEWARQPDGRRYICTCPVSTVMACYDNQTVQAAVNNADMVTADGMPVVWVQRRWGYPAAERVYGPDIMHAVCAATAGQGIRHFFWGGLPGVADQLTEKLVSQYPGLEVVGTYSPPLAAVDQVADPRVVEQLSGSRAHIIWVGLGSPKQDLWMALYRPLLTARLLIGIGAAFDFLSGSKRQAPVWMRRSGLEWCFRLAQEPNRLWRRYLINNPRFIAGVVRQSFQRTRRANTP